MIVVTGGAGFIGSAVVRRLLHAGHEVRVVDNLSKGDTSITLEDCEYISGDVMEPGVCDKALSGAQVCFHLAARIGGIGYFHRYPADILDENNLMLSQIFRTATEHGCKVVYVSSSMVFERTTAFPTPESAIDSSPPPFSAYGFSKMIGEWYCRAFHDQYELTYAIARPFNAYGPGELAGEEPGLAHVIPDLIKKIRDGGGAPIEILGDGRQTRSFTYVEDVADAIVTIGLDPRGEGEDFNIGTGVETSVAQLVRMLWRHCGMSGEPRVTPRGVMPVDVQRRVPAVTKLEKVLGWRARITLEEGLARTVDWYLSRG